MLLSEPMKEERTMKWLKKLVYTGTLLTLFGFLYLRSFI
jgi:hypothetical protein